MNTLIKFTIRSIAEKKMRTFLIIMSICLSVALTFASLSLRGTIMNLFTEQIKQFMGDAEIMVSAGENSKSSWLRLQELSGFEDRVAYQVGTISAGANYEASEKETYSVDVKGYKFEDLALVNPIDIVEETGDNYAGRSIIMGEADATKLGLKLGDSIKLKFESRYYQFKIVKIAASQGLFRPGMGNRFLIVVPPSSLQKMYQINDRYNMILIRSFEGVDDIQLIKDLQKVYNRDEVDDPIPEEEIEQMLNMIIIPFFFMIILVVMTSIFIIYTSFKVITQEKLPILGTFRSLGATKKMTDWILLIESVFYGLVGGVLGSGLGILILKGIIFVILMSDSSGGSPPKIHLAYGSMEFAISIFMALSLAVISSVIPILQISKIPLRDIVLNNIEGKVKTTKFKLILGILLAGTPFMLSIVEFGTAGVLVHSLGMVLMVFGVVLLVPYFTHVIAVVFEKIFGLLFGNLGIIGAKNIRDNKNILNNISLLAIGISGILMINHMSYSVGVEVIDVYNSVHYDIDLYTGGSGSRSLEQRVRTVEGVVDTLGALKVYNVKEVSKNYDISEVFGVNPEEYFDYWAFSFTTDKEEIYNRLINDNGIILTTGIQDIFKLKIGDPFTVKYSYPTEKEVTYKVAGFANTLMNNGRIAYISQNAFKRDTKITNFGQLYLRIDPSQDPEVVVERLKKKFEREDFYIQSINQSKEDNNKGNAIMFSLLTGFSVVAMVIGIFGIFNNFIVSMMSRTRQFAMMRSVGMSKSQMLKMLFTEAFTSGLAGGLVGIVTGVVMIISVGRVLVSIGLPLTIHYNVGMFTTAFISGGIISVLANLLPAFKTSKMNIIEALKYE